MQFFCKIFTISLAKIPSNGSMQANPHITCPNGSAVEAGGPGGPGRPVPKSVPEPGMCRTLAGPGHGPLYPNSGPTHGGAGPWPGLAWIPPWPGPCPSRLGPCGLSARPGPAWPGPVDIAIVYMTHTHDMNSRFPSLNL